MTEATAKESRRTIELVVVFAMPAMARCLRRKLRCQSQDWRCVKRKEKVSMVLMPTVLEPEEKGFNFTDDD